MEDKTKKSDRNIYLNINTLNGNINFGVNVPLSDYPNSPFVEQVGDKKPKKKKKKKKKSATKADARQSAKSQVPKTEPKVVKKAKQMPAFLTVEFTTKLYSFLISNKYIDSTTKLNDFLYRMGAISKQPCKLKRINWLRTKQQLRRLIEAAFEEALQKKIVKKVELERLTAACFTNKGVIFKKLANAKKEESTEMDILENFFASTKTANLIPCKPKV